MRVAEGGCCGAYCTDYTCVAVLSIHTWPPTPKHPALTDSPTWRQRACWPSLARLVPAGLPIPCAYYDAGFLPQHDADRYLAAMTDEAAFPYWAIGGQAAKRYTCVMCDEGFREVREIIAPASVTIAIKWEPV